MMEEIRKPAPAPADTAAVGETRSSTKSGRNVCVGGDVGRGTGSSKPGGPQGKGKELLSKVSQTIGKKMQSITQRLNEIGWRIFPWKRESKLTPEQKNGLKVAQSHWSKKRGCWDNPLPNRTNAFVALSEHRVPSDAIKEFLKSNGIIDRKGLQKALEGDFGSFLHYDQVFPPTLTAEGKALLGIFADNVKKGVVIADSFQRLIESDIPVDEMRKCLMSLGINSPLSLLQTLGANIDSKALQEIFPKFVQVTAEDWGKLDPKVADTESQKAEKSIGLSNLMDDLLAPENRLSDTTIKQFLRSVGITTLKKFNEKGIDVSRDLLKLSRILDELDEIEKETMQTAEQGWKSEKPGDRGVALKNLVADCSGNLEVVSGFLKSKGIQHEKGLKEAIGVERFVSLVKELENQKKELKDILPPPFLHDLDRPYSQGRHPFLLSFNEVESRLCYNYWHSFYDLLRFPARIFS